MLRTLNLIALAILTTSMAFTQDRGYLEFGNIALGATLQSTSPGALSEGKVMLGYDDDIVMYRYGPQVYTATISNGSFQAQTEIINLGDDYDIVGFSNGKYLYFDRVGKILFRGYLDGTDSSVIGAITGYTVIGYSDNKVVLMSDSNEVLIWDLGETGGSRQAGGPVGILEGTWTLKGFANDTIIWIEEATQQVVRWDVVLNADDASTSYENVLGVKEPSYRIMGYSFGAQSTGAIIWIHDQPANKPLILWEVNNTELNPGEGLSPTSNQRPLFGSAGYEVVGWDNPSLILKEADSAGVTIEGNVKDDGSNAQNVGVELYRTGYNNARETTNTDVDGNFSFTTENGVPIDEYSVKVLGTP